MSNREGGRSGGVRVGEGRGKREWGRRTRENN